MKELFRSSTDKIAAHFRYNLCPYAVCSVIKVPLFPTTLFVRSRTLFAFIIYSAIEFLL
jgi:hypothetical protein